jgi:hypothetical protein
MSAAAPFNASATATITPDSSSSLFTSTPRGTQPDAADAAAFAADAAAAAARRSFDWGVMMPAPSHPTCGGAVAELVANKLILCLVKKFGVENVSAHRRGVLLQVSLLF